MDTEKILTDERADALYKRIAKRIEEKKISGSFQMIRYAIDEAWRAGFEEGPRLNGPNLRIRTLTLFQQHDYVQK
jgi:hypothetical protein